MLILASLLAIASMLLWIVDSCLLDASIDLAPMMRVLLVMSGLLIGLNTLITSAG